MATSLLRGPAYVASELSPEAQEYIATGTFNPAQSVGTRTALGDDFQTYEALGGPDEQGYTTYQVYDAYGNPNGQIQVHTSQTAKDVWQGAAPVVLGALSAGLAGPLTDFYTPMLGQIGGAAATGATLGSGSALLSGANTEDILKAGVLGGTVGAVQGYFSPAVTDAATIDAAVKDLTDAYTAAGVPIDYNAIERSLLAQGFNSIDAGAAVDLARSTGTVATTVAPTDQVVNVTGSSLADTSVLEALNLVPPGTFTSSATPGTTTPTTVTQAPTTVAPTEQTVEVTGTTDQQPPVTVAPVVTQPTATTTPPPATVENQTVEVTQPKDLATAADVISLYNSILGRAPDAAGLDFYSKNGFTIDEVRNDMLNSDEYKNKTVGTTPPPTGTQTVDVTGTREGTLTTVSPGTTLVQSTETFKPADVTVEDKKEGEDTGGTTTTTGTGDITTTTTTTEDINRDIDNTNLVDSDPTNKLPSWLTPDLLKALLTLGMFGGGGTGGNGGTGTGPGALPTQGVPTPTTDYYNQVQQYYNQYMPTQPRDVATPLRTWYGGSLFNMPTNIPASPTKTTNTGALTPNIDTQAIIDFLNKYATQQP